MTIHFTSDLHFNHANVIKYCRRPFANVDEMNAALVKNWNRHVNPQDTVYVIGDFALCRAELARGFAQRLNGTKHLIAGNHDHSNRKKYAEGQTQGDFQSVTDIKEIAVGQQRIVMCHYPMMTWNKSGHGAWMLHGHCHGNLKVDIQSLRLDVGVDCFNFTPVSFVDVQYIMSKRAFKPDDHHGAD